MARRDRSYSPEYSNKRVRSSHRSPRSPSPTRRNPRPSNRSRYDDDRDRSRDRDRGGDRDRKDRYKDDRHRDDKRKDPSHRDTERRRSTSRDRRRSPSRERRRDLSPAPRPSNAEPVSTPPPEDPKVKARREKLEAWKKQRDGQKALGAAKAKAMALAGKKAPGTLDCFTYLLFMISHHLIL